MEEERYSGREKRKASLAFLPSRLCRDARNICTLGWGKALGTRLTPFYSAFALWGRMPLGFANCILRFADGNVEYLLGKLDGITRTLCHEPSIAQAAPPI
jgi:hypothetical protein